MPSRAAQLTSAAPIPGSVAGGVQLRLSARPPFAGSAMFEFLRVRAIPGVEDITASHYRRRLQVGDASGWIQVQLDATKPGVVARLDSALAAHQGEIAARLRGLFDLDARPRRIDRHLARDPALAPLVARRPGLRVPGTLDAWELAVRAILGQQVSVQAATTLCGRLVKAFGRRRSDPAPGGTACWGFPTPARLARAGGDQVQGIGLPRARAAAIVALARAVMDRAVSLGEGGGPGAVPAGAGVAAAVAALQRVPGIGPWTASYVAIRAFREPDVFLPGDLAARRALGVESAREAEVASARWSPFRAYALLHLWSAL